MKKEFIFLVTISLISRGLISYAEGEYLSKKGEDLPKTRVGIFSLQNKGENIIKLKKSPKKELTSPMLTPTEGITPERRISIAITPETPISPDVVSKEKAIKEESAVDFFSGREGLPSVSVKSAQKSSKTPMIPRVKSTKKIPSVKKELVSKPPVPENPPLVTPPPIETETQIPEVGVILTKEEEPSSSESMTRFPLVIGLISSGIFIIILIGLIILFSKKPFVNVSSVPTMFPAFENMDLQVNKEIKEIKNGQRTLEKNINMITEKLSLLKDLKGQDLENFTKDVAQKVYKPIEDDIQNMQVTQQKWEGLIGEVDKKLKGLGDLSGLNIKELAQQVSTEFYRPLESELKKMNLSHKKAIEEFEERIETKLTSLSRKNKDTEKIIGELKDKVVIMDSTIATMGSSDLASSLKIPHRRIQSESIELQEKEKTQIDREALRNQIYKMADDGLTIDEIAQKAKIGKGEVRLLLDLRKRR